MNDGRRRVGQVWEFARPSRNPTAMWVIVEALDDGHRVRALDLFSGSTSLFASSDIVEWRDGSASMRRIA